MTTEDHEFETALEEGRDLFNRGCFFEAHDVWEDLWAGVRGAERSFLEGLIHAAVGCYHLNTGNYRGARSQLSLCRDALTPWSPAHRRIDVGAVLAMVEDYLSRLPAGAPPRLDGIAQPEVPERIP